MPIDLKKYNAELARMYYEDPGQKGFNLLLLGEYGSGKTFILRTARFPIHIDSFDPGGTKCLRDLIARGEIVADTRYESEDPYNPSVYEKWYREFNYRKREGYFDQFATYCLDSSTNWGKSVLGAFVKKNGGDPTAVPNYKQHYHFQKFDIMAYIRNILTISCDCIVTGHLAKEKDEDLGQIFFRYIATGDHAQTIPLLFDEIWIMQSYPSGEGVKYRVLTESTGQYQARSRLSAGGRLKTYEEPDIKAILHKVGLPTDNKPKLFSKEELANVRSRVLSKAPVQ